MKKTAICTLLAIMIVLLASCTESKSSRTVYVMDTVASFSLYPENEAAADEISSALNEISDELSPSDGKLFGLNNAGGGEMGKHTRRLLPISQRLYEETRGAFSPYLGSLIELWGIGSKNYVPGAEELLAARSSAKAENAGYTGGRVDLKNGVRLNFGAIAKGYATDVIKEILEKEKVPGAVISLGGNVYVHGTKPGGEAFNVAVRDPAGDENDWILSLPISGKFVISSGDYERYFKKDGKRYHHILDPETGHPAEADLTAVCVISDSGAKGDAYSTALYVMGREAALAFWRERADFELILIGRDRKVTITEGIWESFVPNDEKGYVYEVARR